jgi:hypothetical protein
MDVVVDDKPVKDMKAAAARPARPRWLVPVAAGAAVLLAIGVALAIALPISLRRARLSRGYESLADARGELDARLPPGVERTYYLAADPIDWDYAPSGRNLCKGKEFGEEEELYISKGVGRKFKKAVFREYTDDTFKVGGGCAVVLQRCGTRGRRGAAGAWWAAVGTGSVDSRRSEAHGGAGRWFRSHVAAAAAPRQRLSLPSARYGWEQTAGLPSKRVRPERLKAAQPTLTPPPFPHRCCHADPGEADDGAAAHGYPW